MRNDSKLKTMLASLIAATVLMTTGVSAAETNIIPGQAIVAPTASENRYEAFLGYDNSFAMLTPEQYHDYSAVNLWSGNFVSQFTLMFGNLYSEFTLTLTYNSQANCNIGLGNNVVMNYWAQLTRIDANTLKLMNGTGTIDTFVKNTATGKYENETGIVEELADGGYLANTEYGEYYFDADGTLTRMRGITGYVDVTYNEMGYIETLTNEQAFNILTYQFLYEPSPIDGSPQCVSIESNFITMLEYDEQGNLLSGFEGDYPENTYFRWEYGDDDLMSAVWLDDERITIDYQLIDGYHKVTNLNGTQIVYGKNQTIAIAPNGTMTAWQFDDNGNWLQSSYRR